MYKLVAVFCLVAVAAGQYNVVQTSYEAPAISYAAPVSYAAPAVSYAAPAVSYAAPAASYEQKQDDGPSGVLVGLTYKCKGKYDEVLPSNECNWYTQCSNGLEYKMPCPYGLQWASQYKRCMFPAQSDCGKRGGYN